LLVIPSLPDKEGEGKDSYVQLVNPKGKEEKTEGKRPLKKTKN